MFYWLNILFLLMTCHQRITVIFYNSSALLIYIVIYKCFPYIYKYISIIIITKVLSLQLKVKEKSFVPLLSPSKYCQLLPRAAMSLYIFPLRVPQKKLNNLPFISLYYYILWVFFWYKCLFFFFCHTCGMWKFPGQGLNLNLSSDLSCRSDNAGSLSHCATRELLDTNVFASVFLIFHFICEWYIRSVFNHII